MIKKLFLIIITSFFINKNLYSKEIINNNFNKKIYFGTKIGFSNFLNLKNLNNKFKIINTKFKSNKIGYGSFLGYKINNNFNIELGYENLGKVIKKGKFINGYFKSKGITLSNKINYNIYNNTNIYIKLGWIIIKSISKKNNIINNTKNVISYKKITPLTSLGIEFKISKNLYSRIDYQFINNLGHKNFLHEEPKNSFLNINIIYNINNINNNNKNINYINYNKNKILISKFINNYKIINKKKNIYNYKLYLNNILNLIKKRKYKILSINIYNYSILNNNYKLRLINFIKYKLNKIKINKVNIKVYKLLKNNCKLNNKIECYKKLDKRFLIKIKLL